MPACYYYMNGHYKNACLKTFCHICFSSASAEKSWLLATPRCTTDIASPACTTDVIFTHIKADRYRNSHKTQANTYPGLSLLSLGLRSYKEQGRERSGGQGYLATYMMWAAGDIF